MTSHEHNNRWITHSVQGQTYFIRIQNIYRVDWTLWPKKKKSRLNMTRISVHACLLPSPDITEKLLCRLMGSYRQMANQMSNREDRLGHWIANRNSSCTMFWQFQGHLLLPWPRKFVSLIAICLSMLSSLFSTPLTQISHSLSSFWLNRKSSLMLVAGNSLPGDHSRTCLLIKDRRLLYQETKAHKSRSVYKHKHASICKHAYRYMDRSRYKTYHNHEACSELFDWYHTT